MSPTTAAAPDVSLVDWPIGQAAMLVGVGSDPLVAKRLSELGLRAGATIVPAQRTPGRGLVVHAGELRLALDRVCAEQLRVRAIGPRDPSR